MSTDPLWREQDEEFFRRELASFLPHRIFDAHCHLWPQGQFTDRPAHIPGQADAVCYRRYVRQLHGGADGPALFLPLPGKEKNRAAANAWVAEQARLGADDRGLFLAAPDDDPEWVRSEVRRLGLIGLKCYHTLADVVPTWEAPIPAYLPEPLVVVADQEEWVIVLHLVKSRALADPSNREWISRYCRRYPGIRLILAHSGRGFQPAHNLEGLPDLAALENLYFDSSANCEPLAHEAVLRIAGHRRLLYGSDFYISHQRGRSVAVADTFLWLGEDSPVWREKHQHIRPVLVGLEHLRALKWACWSARLSDSQVEDIFWNNAVRVLGN